MPSRATQHRWTSWQSYLDAHDGTLADYGDHFLVADKLQHVLTDRGAIWRGSLEFLDGIEVVVAKLQLVEMRGGVPWVMTSTYKYQTLRRVGDEVRRIRRYDNTPGHPELPTPHHRHDFDDEGIEAGLVHVGVQGWPNLGEVITELHAVWVAAGERRLVHDT